MKKVDFTITDLNYNSSTRRITFKVRNLNYEIVSFNCDPGCPYIEIKDLMNSSNSFNFVILQWQSLRDDFNSSGYISESRYLPAGWSNSFSITVDSYNHINEENEDNNTANFLSSVEN